MNLLSLDETIAHFDEQIQTACRPFEAAVELLDTIPGFARQTAETVVAEIGTDTPAPTGRCGVSRFQDAKHLAAWVGIAPGNNESAGKRYSGRTRTRPARLSPAAPGAGDGASVRQGNKVLRATLIQAAHATVRMKNTYLAAQYTCLHRRRHVVATPARMKMRGYHATSGWCEVDAHWCHEPEPQADPTT